MSRSAWPDQPHHPLAESYKLGYLADAAYEQDVVTALREAGGDPKPAEAAGKHGLLQIPLESVPDEDKLLAYLRQYQPAALGNYGRNRHCAIGALSADVATTYYAQGPSDSDPKIWPHAVGCHTIRPCAAPADEHRSCDDAGLGVVVGMLDTRISSHEYLTGGFVTSPGSIGSAPSDTRLSGASGHATFVAGLILQQAPAATVHVKQVLTDEGVCDSVTLHDAIIDLAKHPIDILNLSLGCTTADNRPPFALQRALRRFRAERPQAVVVAAAGNHPTHRFWPAALPDVLAVTSAHRAKDGWRLGMGYPAEPWVDVAAPGIDLTSTFLTGDYWRPSGRSVEEFRGWAVGSGTSFACAIVTGYLARNWAPGRRIADLLAAARSAGAPTIEAGDRLVLGVDHLL
jgi:subtilisin family serine protease